MKYVLGKTDVDAVKEGARGFGVNRSAMYKTLADARNEIDHYIPKDRSISKRIVDGSSNALYLYFVYVFQVAIREALLNQVGAKTNAEAIECTYGRCSSHARYVRFVTFNNDKASMLRRS